MISIRLVRSPRSIVKRVIVDFRTRRKAKRSRSEQEGGWSLNFQIPGSVEKMMSMNPSEFNNETISTKLLVSWEKFRKRQFFLLKLNIETLFT